MEQLPKKDIFKTPDGYFQQLTDSVLQRNKNKQRRLVISRWSAAAVLIIGFALFIFRNNIFTSESANNLYALDQEVEFLINQGDLGVEDVLSLSDNPNAILDKIIEEEWSSYELSEAELEQEIWSY